MNTSASPRKYDGPFRSFDRETVAKSLLASLLLAGFVAFAFSIGEIVQQSQAGSDITAASAPVAKPERGGVLLAQTPLF